MVDHQVEVAIPVLEAAIPVLPLMQLLLMLLRRTGLCMCLQHLVVSHQVMGMLIGALIRVGLVAMGIRLILLMCFYREMIIIHLLQEVI